MAPLNLGGGALAAVEGNALRKKVGLWIRKGRMRHCGREGTFSLAWKRTVALGCEAA
jgi:hypothetical protein